MLDCVDDDDDDDVCVCVVLLKTELIDSSTIMLIYTSKHAHNLRQVYRK